MTRDPAGEVGRASSWRTLWASLNLWRYSENVHTMGMVSPLNGESWD